MAGYNFAKKSDIEDVLAMVRQPASPQIQRGFSTKPAVRMSEGLILKTPSGGIPARSADTAGTADCKLYFIDENDDLIELLDNDGSSLTIPVKNIASSLVQGEKYIQAKFCFGRLVADMEDCV